MRFSSKFCTVASCAVLLSALSACSTVSDVKSNGTLASDSTKVLALQKRESALEARERLLAQREANIQTIPASSSHTAGLTPPNAKPGQCFTKIFTPAKYRTVTERKLLEEAGQRFLQAISQAASVYWFLKHLKSYRLFLLPIRLLLKEYWLSLPLRSWFRYLQLTLTKLGTCNLRQRNYSRTSDSCSSLQSTRQ